MKTINDKVEVNLVDLQGKKTPTYGDVSFIELESGDDVLEFMTGKDTVVSAFVAEFNKSRAADKKLSAAQVLIDAANYGFNLKARARVTGDIKAANQGPEVSINRYVKQMVATYAKNGKTITEADARAKVIANAELFGLDLSIGVAA